MKAIFLLLLALFDCKCAQNSSKNGKLFLCMCLRILLGNHQRVNRCTLEGGCQPGGWGREGSCQPAGGGAGQDTPPARRKYPPTPFTNSPIILDIKFTPWMPLSRGRLCLVGGATLVPLSPRKRWGEGRGGGRSNCLSLLEGAEKLPVNPKKARKMAITPGLLCCQLSFQDLSADLLTNAAE